MIPVDQKIATTLLVAMQASNKDKAKQFKMAQVSLRFDDSGNPSFEVNISPVTAVMGTDFNWHGSRCSTEHVYWNESLIGSKCCKLVAPLQIKASGFLWCPENQVEYAKAFMKREYVKYMKDRAKEAQLLANVSYALAEKVEGLDIREGGE